LMTAGRALLTKIYCPATGTSSTCKAPLNILLQHMQPAEGSVTQQHEIHEIHTCPC
jgi:hypothetical protein